MTYPCVAMTTTTSRTHPHQVCEVRGWRPKLPRTPSVPPLLPTHLFNLTAGTAIPFFLNLNLQADSVIRKLNCSNTTFPNPRKHTSVKMVKAGKHRFSLFEAQGDWLVYPRYRSLSFLARGPDSRVGGWSTSQIERVSAAIIDRRQP